MAGGGRDDFKPFAQTIWALVLLFHFSADPGGSRLLTVPTRSCSCLPFCYRRPFVGGFSHGVGFLAAGVRAGGPGAPSL